ncbi:MAG: phosphoenolpyruvate carboxykinase (ATP) [Phycisphaerae bacterium]
MDAVSIHPSKHGFDTIGLEHQGRALWNLRAPTLIEESLRRGEGDLSITGALVALTGKRTGRSPKDKFFVEEPGSKDRICWGKVNAPISPTSYDQLEKKMYAYLRDKNVFVQDLWCGANEQYRLPVRVITEYAWHSLFARQLFIRPPMDVLENHFPEFTVIDAPGCMADPATDGTNSETFVVVNLAKKRILIGGTQYAGEIKKSIFTIMNYLLPLKGVAPMHCSANIGAEGDVALFFGLSGTGKTTLSADPERKLIGDDEHGWGEDGVFNFEGGCYAKCIKLSRAQEPDIYDAIRFGAVLENVVLDPFTHEPNFDNAKHTENTRAAYPLRFISNAVEPSVGGHPKNVIFLTCDAFGVLPPIARLTPEQAMYHFLSGYTAKVAGTEAGLGNEPQATFSTGFGEPFLPLDPSVYAELLGKKTTEHNSRIWLVNTGWSGGPYGVGSRIKLKYTRAMINAALAGELDNVKYEKHPIFGIDKPQSCPDIPGEVLNARNTWSDHAAYDRKAKELAGLFIKNFERFPDASDRIRAAGPRL